MAVSAAQVTVAPMRRELRLLGTTVAARHLQLRAPSAGRVLGFNLQNGDRVHRGEVVAHVLNREVEAATNGLAVAERFDSGRSAGSCCKRSSVTATAAASQWSLPKTASSRNGS